MQTTNTNKKFIFNMNLLTTSMALHIPIADSSIPNSVDIYPLCFLTFTNLFQKL